MQESEKLPAALCVLLGTGVLFDDDDPYSGEGDSGVIVATVFEDPSINASDVEIARTGSRELAIWGTGFSNMTTPVIDFDPPLDSSNVDVKVSSRHEGVRVWWWPLYVRRKPHFRARAFGC